MRIAKSGTVLPYIMVLGTAMFILASSLLALLNISVINAKNSMNYAEAYCNARSALSFAQGILKTDSINNSLDSFYLTGTKNSQNMMEFTCIYDEPPASSGHVYAVCAYSPTTQAIEITSYIKTPTYSKNKTINYYTTFIPSGSLDSSYGFSGGNYR